MRKFKLGDRVEVSSRYTGIPCSAGEDDLLYGNICKIESSSVGVRHDIENSHLHDCDGTCDNKHGWYYYKPEVKLTDHV